MTTTSATTRTLAARALGLVPYAACLALQEDAVRARAEGRGDDTLFLVEHPPVLTAGRGTGGDSLRADAATLARAGLEVVPVARGGDVTWHGPGQLIGYPVCDLAAEGAGSHDLHRFLRGLEEGLIATLAAFGIAAERSPGRTGVWVADRRRGSGGARKIASIGIAVRRWVSYHGFALNVRPSLDHFGLIHPCGLHGVEMTSMAIELGAAAPAWADVVDVVACEVPRALGYAGAGSVTLPPGAAWSATARAGAR